MNTTKLPQTLKIHDKFFKYYSDEKVEAYYQISFHNYSEKLGKEHYICHIVLLEPFKMTNYAKIFKIEEIALQELFSTDSSIDKEEVVFSLIVELTEGAKFTPDINTIRNVNKYKINLEKTHNITLNFAAVILPRKFTKTFKIFKFITKYFSKGEEMAIIVNNYKEALEKLDSIDYILDTESFDKNIS